jgi:hypothetical protein
VVRKTQPAVTAPSTARPLRRAPPTWTPRFNIFHANLFSFTSFRSCGCILPTMPTVVVTVTATATATAASSGDASSLSAEATAGIIIGSLLGGVFFIALVLYLLNRYTRHKFSRVANHDVSATGGALDLPRTSSRRMEAFTRHSQRPSMSSEPLMPPASWPPANSRALSPSTPPRLDSTLPGVGDSPCSTFDFGEISQVIASGTVSRSAIPAQQASPGSSRPDLGNSPPITRQTSGDGAASPSTPFIHRMIQSRAQASEGVSLAHRPSLEFSQSRSTTLDSSADGERLLAEAERTALRDADTAQRGEEEEIAEGEEGWDEVDSTESIYSQVSAPLDHSGFFSDPVSRPNSSLSVHRRKSSRRRARTSAPRELPPVAETSNTPRAPTVSLASTAANSSVDGRVSHGTASGPMSSVVDQPGTLPLLTSANFGKDSTTSGSISSTAGWGSGSSGRASRYPSLAPSSVAQSSRSGPRSDGGTDWHHPPSGLAGLRSLQIGALLNPHSPVEEQAEPRDEVFAGSPAGAAPVKRAHLREGTAGSMPEVERRDVMQGGIAHIDVTL